MPPEKSDLSSVLFLHSFDDAASQAMRDLVHGPATTSYRVMATPYEDISFDPPQTIVRWTLEIYRPSQPVEVVELLPDSQTGD